LPEDATLAIYMPGRDLSSLVAELRHAGVAEDMPCVAVSCAATPRQRADAAVLASFAAVKPGGAPVLVLVGRAMQGMLVRAEDAAVRGIVQDAVLQPGL
jgi:uroporphyrin-III C-methyltransferase